MQVVVPTLPETTYDSRILAFALAHLSDGEVRVRNAVADTLGALTAKHGTRIWHACKADVMASIQNNYVRSLVTWDFMFAGMALYTLPPQCESVLKQDSVSCRRASDTNVLYLRGKAWQMSHLSDLRCVCVAMPNRTNSAMAVVSQERQSAETASESGDDRNAPGSPSLGAGGAAPPAGTLMGDLLATSYSAATPGQGTCRHMTEGWKALESSVRCVHRVATGAGAAFAPEATPELRGLLYQCFNHMNRFVRETAYLAQAALCASLAGTGVLAAMAREVAERVNDGLSDNWSQVRESRRALVDLCMRL